MKNTMKPYSELELLLHAAANKHRELFNLFTNGEVASLDSLLALTWVGDLSYLKDLGEFYIVEVKNSNDYDSYDTLPVYSVLYFADYDVYIKFDGWWSSYQGVEFESFRRVTPTTKTITVYE